MFEGGSIIKGQIGGTVIFSVPRLAQKYAYRFSAKCEAVRFAAFN
ncbi:uncharacterized protein METZ01_LOCUS83336 [marine metagenome]|uniref:Uncharacterized protein n=1 Tax=marine metagenome TaxID=408172 RepID=A0A381UQN7_9ZZZZ